LIVCKPYLELKVVTTTVVTVMFQGNSDVSTAVAKACA